MPFYTIRNNSTLEETEISMNFCDLVQYLKDNPNLEQIPTKLNIADPVSLGRHKPPRDFRKLIGKCEGRYKGDY